MLNQDFKEFIESLNKNEVEYMVIGGYAMAIHGHPRYTKDIVLWINHTADNASKLIRALDDFGMGSLGLKPSDFQIERGVIQLGLPPNRIDLITGIAGLSFDDAYGRRERIEMDGVSVNFTARDDLIATKRSAGRLQDLADIEQLDPGD